MTGGGQGRPLRFLVALVVGWVGVRAAMLWPRLDPVPALVGAVVPVATAAPHTPVLERPAVAPPLPEINAISGSCRTRAVGENSAACTHRGHFGERRTSAGRGSRSIPTSIVPARPTDAAHPARRTLSLALVG